MRYQKTVTILACVILALFVYYFVSYNNTPPELAPSQPGSATTTPDLKREIIVSEEQDITTRQQRDIIAFTDSAVAKFRAKDFTGFAQHIHPTKGLRVALYQYFDARETGDTVLFANADAFVRQSVSTTPRIWGHADGSGEPVRLGFSQLYSEWLYAHDYLQSPIVRVFREYSNLSEAYPDARIVLYEFPGFDKKYEGMDWSGLVVGIEEYEGEWYVVVLTHAQWMI